MAGSSRLVLFALLLLSLTPPGAHGARAQSLVRGGLEGVVRDSTGAMLNGAGITLRDVSTGLEQTSSTSTDGRFSFSLLAPGEFELLVERFGYVPLRVGGIPVRAGRRADVFLVLAGTDDPAAQTDSVRYAGGSTGRLEAGRGQHFGSLELVRLPEQDRALTSLVGIVTSGGAGLELEGLPASQQEVAVDGVPALRMRHPGSSSQSMGIAPLVLSRFERAELASSALDVEWRGESGGLLSGHTRRGTPELRVEAFGNGSLATAPPDGPQERAAATEVGVLVSGPIVRDTAGFVVGLEGWRRDDPAAFTPDGRGAAERAAAIAADSFGVTLPLPRGTRRSEAVAGFLRVDWQIGAPHSLSIRSGFSIAPQVQELAGRPPFPGAGRYEEAHFTIATDFASRLSPRLAQEIRVSADLGRREYGSEPLAMDAGRVAPEGLTSIIGEGLPLASERSLSGVVRQTALRASEALHISAGRHLVKVGLLASVQSYEFSDAGGASLEFTFPTLNDFAAGRGAFVQGGVARSTASFNIPQLAAFLQDTWRPAQGMELLIGVRMEAEALPASDVTPNREWLARTGLESTGLPGTRVWMSPRLGLTWKLDDPQRWILSAGAGLFSGSLDPTLLAELLSYDSGVEVRRGVGRLTAWPLPPDSVFAPVVGRRLTLLGPGYTGPRTIRGSTGVSYHHPTGTSLHVSTASRRTDFLPRRRDLNLPRSAIGEDQYGRPLQGALRKHGSLLVAESGSNRRFPGFDRVSAIEVDGWSTYHGITLGAEHAANDFRLFGSYTRAVTRDNWPAGLEPGVEILPFAAGANGLGSAEGPGDLDIPHRAVALAEGRLRGARELSVAAVYRYRSGYPFTPGFEAGVDANGDGSVGNDPAFVSADFPGMAPLLSGWTCLAEVAGGFAGRNSCRGPAAHTLDLRVGLQLGRVRRYSMRLVLDGLDLVGSRPTLPDPALYLVDPSGSIGSDTTSATTSVPLLLNEGFGEPLLRLSSGPLLRLGLRLTH